MYPSVKLKPEYWSLQKYLWSEGLELGVEPVVKVIIRVIFGVRSSGNIAISAIRKLAKLIGDVYPGAAKVLLEQIYVDDVLPEGQENLGDCHALADELTVAVESGGLSLKGFTFSGSSPNPELSEDGESI